MIKNLPQAKQQEILQDMFEMIRISYRDEAQAHHETWKDLDRQLFDALTFKQFNSLRPLTSYTARYKYIRRISKSKKLQHLAWLTERAFELKQESAAKYKAHLELDPESTAVEGGAK